MGRDGAGGRENAPSSLRTYSGAVPRAVLELAGYRNVLTKSFGTNNPINLVKATFNALSKLRTREEAAALRGVALDES
jgi:small subunit ribosomal protein S5